MVDKYQIQQERNRLISQTDWTQLNDNQLTAEEKQAFADYRQQLRDITVTYDNNWENIVWPELPTS